MIKFVLAKLRGMVTYNEMELMAKAVLRRYLAAEEEEVPIRFFKANADWSRKWMEWFASTMHRIADSKNRSAQRLQIRREMMNILELDCTSAFFLKGIFTEDNKRILADLLYPGETFETVVNKSHRIYAFCQPSHRCLAQMARVYYNDAAADGDCSFYTELYLRRLTSQYQLWVAQVRKEVSADYIVDPMLVQLTEKTKSEFLQGSKVDYDYIIRVTETQMKAAKAAMDKALVDWPMEGSKPRIS